MIELIFQKQLTQIKIANQKNVIFATINIF